MKKIRKWFFKLLTGYDLVEYEDVMKEWKETLYLQTYITLDEEELRLLNIPEEYWEDLDVVNDAIHSMIYKRKEN